MSSVGPLDSPFDRAGLLNFSWHGPLPEPIAAASLWCAGLSGRRELGCKIRVVRSVQRNTERFGNLSQVGNRPGGSDDRGRTVRVFDSPGERSVPVEAWTDEFLFAANAANSPAADYDGGYRDATETGNWSCHDSSVTCYMRLLCQFRPSARVRRTAGLRGG